MIKIIFALLILITVKQVEAQQKATLGVEISPSIKFQTIRNTVTGLFTSFGGYGFNVGLPVKYLLLDNKSVSTGLTYEFTAFDTRINTVLINSLRLNTLNVPIVYNYPIKENYFVNMGGGVNYIFVSKEYSGGIWTNINPLVNQFQPYICLGGALLKHKANNMYEFGINVRYHLFNLWSLNTLTSTNIVSVDLNLKYFF